MTTYCNNINFPQIAKDILTNDQNIVNLPKNILNSQFMMIFPEQFPKEFNTWLEDTLQLTVAVSEIFLLGPNARHLIHVDGPVYPTNKAKLNFIIGGAGSEMVWYKPKEEIFNVTNLVSRSTTGGSVLLSADNAVEVHRAALANFCIVDAGTFHTVVNKQEPRIAWNLGLVDCKTNHRLLLTELRERLSEYVVD